MTSVFRKLLQLTSSQKRTVSVGTMTNLIVVDSQRVMDVVWDGQDWWYAPVFIILNFGILFWLVGISALGGK